MLLIHGAHLADALQPLVAEPALERLQRIRYQRRGLGGSTRPVDAGPTSVAEQANDAIGLLDHLGVDRAHLVGHSLGGAIALELAAQHPTRVASLVLLEPVLLTTPAGAAFARALAPSSTATKPATPRPPCTASWPSRVTATGTRRSTRPCRAGSRRPSRTPRPSARQRCLESRPGPSAGAGGGHHLPRAVGPRQQQQPPVRRGPPAAPRLVPACQDANIVGATHLLQMQAPGPVATATAAFL
jgi:pimeloyl-ACP methyl ester carboxylesterase